MSENPNPTEPRLEWLRWQISDELCESVAPGLREGRPGAVRELKRWLTKDRERIVNYCHGAMNVHGRNAGIPPFSKQEIAHEIGLVAWCHGIDEHQNREERKRRGR